MVVWLSDDLIRYDRVYILSVVQLTVLQIEVLNVNIKIIEITRILYTPE